MKNQGEIGMNNSGVKAEAAVVPAFHARTEAESARNPPSWRRRRDDHQLCAWDFHHSQKKFDELFRGKSQLGTKQRKGEKEQMPNLEKKESIGWWVMEKKRETSIYISLNVCKSQQIRVRVNVICPFCFGLFNIHSFIHILESWFDIRRRWAGFVGGKKDKCG